MKIFYNILDAPKVSVTKQAQVITEGSPLVLFCEVEAGNPAGITSMYWEFQPKYLGMESQPLQYSGKGQELRINRTTYSDAGTYACTAKNSVGTNTARVEVAINCEYHWTF